MIGRVRCGIALVLLVMSGCNGKPAATTSSQSVLDGFAKMLDSFERSVEAAASAGPADRDEIAVDLRHRVGQLEESVSDLLYKAGNKTDARASLDAISQTLGDLRRATEGSINVAKLRDEARKLKSQADELRGKL